MSPLKRAVVKSSIPKNEQITIKGRDGISVTTSDIESTISSFKRGIEVTSATDKKIKFKFVLSFASDNVSEDVYDQLKNNPSAVTGTFSISTEGQEIYTMRIEKGVAQKSVRKVLSAQLVPPVHDASVGCGVGTVHDCVSYKIESMNWVDYGLCLASAPACYGGLWASCTWDVCNSKMRYTDPNAN